MSRACAEAVSGEVGRNGAGKSTLLREIAYYRLDKFPKNLKVGLRAACGSCPKIEPHNPRTTPTKAKINITIAIVGVVYIFSKEFLESEVVGGAYVLEGNPG